MNSPWALAISSGLSQTSYIENAGIRGKISAQRPVTARPILAPQLRIAGWVP
jgi:hypothetical protein